MVVYTLEEKLGEELVARGGEEPRLLWGLMSDHDFRALGDLEASPFEVHYLH